MVQFKAIFLFKRQYSAYKLNFWSYFEGISNQNVKLLGCCFCIFLTWSRYLSGWINASHCLSSPWPGFNSQPWRRISRDSRDHKPIERIWGIWSNIANSFFCPQVPPPDDWNGHGSLKNIKDSSVALGSQSHGPGFKSWSWWTPVVSVSSPLYVF